MAVAAGRSDGIEIATLARRHGALPPPVALAVLGELLRLLEAEHARGRVVGAIAAHTVLLTPEGCVLTEGNEHGPSIYHAPERLAAATTATDLYAAGVLFSEMLQGCPHRGDAGPLPSLFELDPTVPGVIEHVFESLTARNPARRFSSATEALVALKPIDELLLREHPRLLRDFMHEPTSSMERMRRMVAGLEVARADALLAASTSNVPAAAFALYRAQRLEPRSAIATRLQRLCDDARLAFDLPDDEFVTSLKNQIAKDPYNTTAMRQLASYQRERGDVYQAAIWWRRVLRLTPADTLLLRQLELVLVGVTDAPLPAREWFGLRVDVASLRKQATLALLEPRATVAPPRVADVAAVATPTVWQRVRDLLR